MFDHKESPYSNCCEAHFKAAYSVSPSPFGIGAYARNYGFVFLVENVREAEALARSLHIPKEYFKYCYSEKDIVGYRLPTKKQLFISERLNTLDNFLHKRFHRIVRPDMTIVEPHLKPYPKY